MKKVLALVLAVVMVCGLAAIATSAKTTATVKLTSDYDGLTFGDTVWIEAGKEFTISVEPDDADTINSKVSVDVKVEKASSSQKAYVQLVERDGYDFTFETVVTDPTVVQADKVATTITFTVKNGTLLNGSNFVTVWTGVSDDEIVTEREFKSIQNANKDVTDNAKKATIKVGDYITITDVTSPADVNKTVVSSTPSAVAEALEGKNYVFAGYKYAQNLPGVGTMKVSLNAPLMLNNPKGVYVYQYSDGKLTLYPSTADNKTWEVKDGAVEFPVSTTAQWVVTDKQITSSNTSNNTNTNTNPGTGANDMIGAAVVMALVAAAGVVAFKK